jgi:hypothetical protein
VKTLNRILVGAVVLALTVSVIALVTMVANAPARPLSYNAQQFKAFEAAYITAYDSFRLAKFEDSVTGELVIFEGQVWGVSNTGLFFEMVPIGYEFRGNNHPRMQANVFLPKGVYVPTTLRQSQRVKVTGHITTCGETGVFIRGKVEAL